MSTLWSERQRQAWRAFLEAVQLRSRREAEIRTGFAARTEEIDQSYQADKTKLEGDQQTELENFELKKAEAIDTLGGKYDAALAKGKSEYQGLKQKAVEDYNTSRAELEAEFKEARWTLGTIREADSKNSQDALQQHQQ